MNKISIKVFDRFLYSFSATACQQMGESNRILKRKVS